MSIPELPPIYATVVFAQNKPGAILSIPPLPEVTTFHMKDGAVRTAGGRELAIVDDAARTRVLEEFARDPSSVFVVEAGPLGFIRDYPIAPEIPR